MGRLDQYAKEILAMETPAVTHGAAVWQPPVEINLTEVRLDGCLLIRDRASLASLPPPWSEAREGDDEIVLEDKMQGDHLDMRAYERACLRRQARQVQRMEAPNIPWEGDIPLWMVASHVPAILPQRRTLRPVAPGCHRIETGSFQFLWIAANELPLCDELVPFLIARSGSALDEFGFWIRDRRPTDWISRMVEFLPMSTAVHEELLRFVLTKSEDPEVQARQKLVAKVYVDMTPEVKAEVTAEAVAAAVAETKKAASKAAEKAHLERARSAVRRVLDHRKLTLSAEDEARLGACTDLGMLDRWLEQAVDAPSAADALR